MRVVMADGGVVDGFAPRSESRQVPIGMSTELVSRLDALVQDGSRSAAIASLVAYGLDQVAAGNIKLAG